MIVTLRKLRRGTVEMGEGITLTPIFDERNRLAGVSFSHPTDDGVGCSRFLPLQTGAGLRRTQWRYQSFREAQAWYVKSRAREPLDLSPSLWCKDHGVHGFIDQGRWVTIRSIILTWITQKDRHDAEQMIKDLGGDMDAAILAIADLMRENDRLKKRNRSLEDAAKRNRDSKKKVDQPNQLALESEWADFVRDWNDNR